MKNKSTVIHVEFKDKKTHHYFGGIAAIFDSFDEKLIGISAHSLYEFDIDENKPYSNKRVIIRKGSIHRKPFTKKRVKKSVVKNV